MAQHQLRRSRPSRRSDLSNKDQVVAHATSGSANDLTYVIFRIGRWGGSIAEPL